jgi:hypothetical protein
MKVVRIDKRRHLFRRCAAAEAIDAYRRGLTPAAIERTLIGGAGVEYLGRKWQMTSADAAGLAVYYGIWTPAEADAKLKEIYS